MTKFLKNADVTGYISQTLVTSSLLKTDSSGKLVAATAGTDYQAPTAALLPTGGTAGQILAKIDATNYNTQWIDNFAQQLKHDVKLGATLAKGKAVYVSSANGTNMIVSAADNSTEATSSKTLGLLETGGVTNDIVKVITEGLLAGLDTSTATAGDPVWLGTNGNLIFGLANKPVAPAHLVFIGIVTRVQSVNGEIFVKVQNGFELNEIHNVLLSSTANNDGLFYESSSGLWKNKSIATVLGYTPANGANYLPLTGGTLTGGLYINPANTGVVGLDVASNTIRFRTDSGQPFNRQLTTTLGSGTLVKMQAAGYGATYVTDLGFYTSSGSAVNTTPNLYLTGGNNRVGINTDTPSYVLDVQGTAGVSGQLYLGSTITNGTYTYTLPSATGTLALASSLTGFISGSGTSNYVPKFTASQTIGNSSLKEMNTGWMQLGDSSVSNAELDLIGNSGANIFMYDGYGSVTIQTYYNDYFTILAQVGATTRDLIAYKYSTQTLSFWNSGSGAKMSIFSNGNTIIGGTADAGYKLDVQGTGRFTGSLTLGSTITNGTYTYTLPSATGTLALVSSLGSYVPYTGATSTVDLGNNNIEINGTTAYVRVQGGGASGFISESAGAKMQLSPTSLVLTEKQSAPNYTKTLDFRTSILGANYTIIVPDASGTIALTSQLASYVPTSRTLTINGTAYDLSANRSWTINPAASARTEQIFTATSGQTTFTVTGGYVVGLVDVYINGVKLLPADFTATNGSTVVLGTGAVLNDSVTIINYTATIAALPTSRDVIDYTATSAQTTFTVSGGYTVGLLDVYVNGVKLTSSEYTATNGTTFVLTVASVTGDQVQAIRYNASVNGVSGSGTANYLPKFTASQTLGNSLIQDDGTTVTIGSTDSSLLMPRAATSNNATVNFATGGTVKWNVGLRGLYSADDFYIFNPVLGINYITLSAASSLANFGVAIRASTFTSYTASGAFLNNSSAGTSSTYIRVNNTGGDLRTGIESSAGGVLQTGTSAYAAVFGNHANYATQFTTNGTVRMTIDNTGATTFSNSVTADGLGSGISALSSWGASPVRPIIEGREGNAISNYVGLPEMYYTSNAYYNGTAWIRKSANPSINMVVSGYNNNFLVQSAPTGTAGGTVSFSTLFYINGSNGNIGIGTTSPASKLHIEGTGTGAWLTINRTDTGTNIVDYTQSGTRLGYIGYIGSELWINNATASDISIRTSGAERMRITSGGDVCIGTTSALQPASGRGTISINGSSSSILSLGIGGSVKGYMYAGGTTLGLEAVGAQDMTFAAGSAERMRIRSDGAVVIGRDWGNVYSMTSGGGTGTAIVDTGITYNSGDYGGFSRGATYLVVFNGNPNAGGSGAYFAQYTGIISIYTGWSGSAVTTYINYTQLASGNNIGALTLTPVFWNGSSESSSVNVYTSGAQIRLKIAGYNSSYTGQDQSVYLKRLT